MQTKKKRGLGGGGGGPKTLCSQLKLLHANTGRKTKADASVSSPAMQTTPPPPFSPPQDEKPSAGKMKFPRNPFPRIASDAPTRKEQAGTHTHTHTHFFHAQPHKHARPNRRQKRRPSPSARRKEERRSQPLTEHERMPSCVCCLLRRACVACWCGVTPPQYIPIHPVCIHIYILRMYR